MRPFRFRLGRVLSYRRLCEEKLRNDLNSMDMAMRNKAEQVTLWRERGNGIRGELQSEQASGITGWEAWLYWQFLQRVEKEIRSQQKAIEELSALRNEHQRKLKKAHNERKAMERLKERAGENFHREFLHDEQKHLDEVAARSFHRLEKL